MEAVIYSNGNQECERAKTLLEKLNFQISGEEAEYPQVNVGFKHIGGLKDVLHYMKDNGLIK
jgi:hypothetical protein